QPCINEDDFHLCLHERMDQFQRLERVVNIDPCPFLSEGLYFPCQDACFFIQQFICNCFLPVFHGSLIRSVFICFFQPVFHILHLKKPIREMGLILWEFRELIEIRFSFLFERVTAFFSFIRCVVKKCRVPCHLLKTCKSVCISIHRSF